MKIFRRSLAAMLLLGGMLHGCVTPPVFPLEPIVSNPVVEFIDVVDANARDTLALTIHFTDGDGDLGLLPSETESPYNLRNYFPDHLNNNDTLFFGDPMVSDIPYSFPYTCLNWELKLRGFELRDGVQVAIYDTLYYEINDNHYNITIDWFTKPDGGPEWVPFDWRLFREPSCGETFDGRFPILFDEEDLDDGVVTPYPLEGDIRYSMTSSGFLLLFGADSVRMDIRIKDRSLQESNVVQARFTLPSIRREE